VLVDLAARAGAAVGTKWVLLLRAVNLGPTNKLAMADLRELLEQLGHTDVKTVLNSGNALFTSSRRSAAALAREVEDGLRARGLDVRACVRTQAQLQAALGALPADLPEASYVLVTVLFDEPVWLAPVLDHVWPAEQVRAGDGVLYLAYGQAVHSSKLTAGWLEKRLGVATTSRTPATLRKLL